MEQKLSVEMAITNKLCMEMVFLLNMEIFVHIVHMDA